MRKKKDIDYTPLIMMQAAALCHIVMDVRTADTITEIAKYMRKKGDAFNVKDACIIMARMEAKYPRVEPEPQPQSK